MTSNNQNTAILIFSRTEKDEAVQKQFLPYRYKSKNQKIARKLIQNTLQTIKKTNLPYFIIDSDHQQGFNFGEKISNAIKTVFNKGFENVITLGNDCPDLSVENILQAEKNLNSSKASLGPSKDGGAYLIAINKDSFDFENFKDLFWQTDRLLLSLKNYLGNLNKPIIELSDKVDIDSYLDLYKYLTDCPKINFKKAIEAILNDVSIDFKVDYSIPRKLATSFQLFGLRAPPQTF